MSLQNILKAMTALNHISQPSDYDGSIEGDPAEYHEKGDFLLMATIDLLTDEFGGEDEKEMCEQITQQFILMHKWYS